MECRKEVGKDECGCLSEVVIEDKSPLALVVQQRLERFLKGLVVSEVLFPQTDNRSLDYVHQVD